MTCDQAGWTADPIIRETRFSSDRQDLTYEGCLEVRLSELFYAVLCTEVVHSHKHT